MKRIALVEDNADNRLLLRALLEDRYELVEYETGPDALAGIVAEPPDLVVLDVSLPGMDGTEVLTRLRRDDRGAGLPVIALTAYAMVGDRERLLALGFDAYVSKPVVDDRAFLELVKSLLHRRKPASR